jgi:hypothetical protein
MYKVVLVPASCGQTTLDIGLIEKNANSMQAEGYDLAHVYQTSSAGCIGTKSAVVMVFRQRD